MRHVHSVCDTMNMATTQQERLEYLRGELQAERISYEELAELQSLRDYIEPSDVQLLEAAGVPEDAINMVSFDLTPFIELTDNFPEHAISFRCTGWDYEKREFDFVDVEGDKEVKYMLTRDKWIVGLRLYFNNAIKNEGEISFDMGDYDAPRIDNILQWALLGEVRYC